MPKPGLRKVDRVRVFEQAAEQLKTEILGAGYKVGARLPTEQELCEALSVSRSTVREALRVLEAEGFIEVRQGSGAYVTHPLTGDQARNEIRGWLVQRGNTLVQLLQVRASIEGLTAGLVAKKAADSAVAEIRGLVEAQMSLPAMSESQLIDRLVDLDVSFHTAISAASGNDIAHEIVSHIVPAFMESNRAVLKVAHNPKMLMEEHLSILRAIEARDEQGAERSMRTHITRVQSEIAGLPVEGSLARPDDKS